MKGIIISMIAVASFIFTASAQKTVKMKHHQHRHGNAMMMKELNLSTAQKNQIKSSRENTRKQLMELDKNDNITVKEYKTRKEAIQKTQKEQMNGLLTTEQKNQLAEKKIERKAKHDLDAAKKLDKMKSRLNLSEVQMTNIKANRAANYLKAKAIKQNGQLSKTEKKEQLMTLKKAQKESFKELLTPEQIIKMEELKKDRLHKTGRK